MPFKKLKKRWSRFYEDVAIKLSAKRMRTAIHRYERRAGLTRMGGLGIGLAILLWGFARLIAGKTLYLFAYGAILLVIGTWATAKRRLPLEGGRSEVRARAREGEILGVELSLRSKRRLTTIVLEEEVPERLGGVVSLPIPSIKGGEEVTHTYRLHCRRRGVYKLGPLVARWGDPIGLTQREMELAPAFELLVHPSVEPVASRPLTRQFEDPPIRPPVSKPWNAGMEFYGMRDYSPGDDLRRIVWKAFARTGRLLVREFEQGITDSIVVMLDTDPRHHSREEPSESFECAVKVAASICVKALGEGYSVGCDTNDGKLTKMLRGPDAPIQMLDALARVDHGKGKLDTMIMRRIADPARTAHHILITPRLNKEAAAKLRMLLGRGVSIMVIALIWDEEAEETLGTAASLGCQVTEIRAGQSIADAFMHEIGAGRR